MPAKIKPPVVHQCGTQWAVKKHGVVYDKESDTRAMVTLCGRQAQAITAKKFDPASELSCGRCVVAYQKRYGA